MYFLEHVYLVKASVFFNLLVLCECLLKVHLYTTSVFMTFLKYEQKVRNRAQYLRTNQWGVLISHFLLTCMSILNIWCQDEMDLFPIQWTVKNVQHDNCSQEIWACTVTKDTLSLQCCDTTTVTLLSTLCFCVDLGRLRPCALSCRPRCSSATERIHSRPCTAPAWPNSTWPVSSKPRR